MKITTKSGFEIDFNTESLDSMEVLDELTSMEDGDIFAVSRLCKMILSKEDRKRLYDHVRDESGRVPFAKISEEITETFLLCGQEGKN